MSSFACQYLRFQVLKLILKHLLDNYNHDT